MAKSIKRSPSNALGVPGQSLQHFSLLELQQFTKEKIYSTDASKDFHLFYVGRDDVHDILKYVLSRVSTSLYPNPSPTPNPNPSKKSLSARRRVNERTLLTR